jgi:hypothetical protein
LYGKPRSYLEARSGNHAMDQTAQLPVVEGVLFTETDCDDVQFDRNRAAVLDYLYELDGRGDEHHPLRHTYTALAENFKEVMGQLVLDELTRGWHQNQQPVIVIDFRDAAPESEA